MAEKFLRLVAEDLLNTYGSNLSKVTVVIPGKRAKLFMNQYLAQLSKTPVWAPRYQTIDELFLELSPYKKAEQIETICLLYKIYCELVPDAESLDEFYSWGEIILSDFDDIDKHRAPAKELFANVYDLHAIEQSYLTPEQKETLKQFFSNFSEEKNSELKRRFLNLWSIMADLYTRLQEELKARGYLYSGALYRNVVDQLEKEDSSESIKMAEMRKHDYAIVGFNVVDECEENLFKALGEEHTQFYWDYDEMYLNDVLFKVTQKDGSQHKRTFSGAPWEAGLFLKDNLKKFPNRLDPKHFDNLKHLKDINFVATSTDNAQARYIPKWIDQHLTEQENETAIVLCDEHLIQPVLHALPEESPKQINVTMGFPLADTPIYSFLSLLTAMQIDGWDEGGQKFRYTFKEKVVRHPYFNLIEMDLFVHHTDNLNLLQYLQEVVGQLGTYYIHRIQQTKAEANAEITDSAAEAKEDKAEDHKIDIYDQLYSEALFQVHKILNRFTTIIEEGILNVLPLTLRRLIRNVMTSTSIPFHGEPAIGMQVMGLMETRNLDFSHLLMLNVGEGTMPKKADDNSLIPYQLREHFKLTTISHRISVFAYYFFRLLQRAEHVTLVYNENTSGVKNNEMSRFMRQLMAETNLPIRYIRLTPENQQNDKPMNVMAVKTPEVLDKLTTWVKNNVLSPTAINAYLNCPMQFYFKYVAGMRVDPKAEDSITPAEMGDIFHKAAENFYKDLTAKYGKTLTAEMIKPALEHKETQLARYIDMGKHESNCGLPMIIRNVILEYLCQLLRFDIAHAPITIEATEVKYQLGVDISADGEAPFVVNIGGTVDRLDRNENGYVVVDYKTGGHPDSIADIEAIYKHSALNAGYFFQTFLYALAVSQKHNCGVKPSLLYIHRASDAAHYDPSLSFKKGKEDPVIIDDVRQYKEEYLDKLKECLRDLFNPDLNFTQTDNESKCTYCDYHKLCNKKIKKY